MGLVRPVSWMAALMLASACAGTGTATRPPDNAPAWREGAQKGARSAEGAVICFMEAAARRDLIGMARSFGTRGGPVLGLGPDADAEVRMEAIASILDLGGYEIVSDEDVAGEVGGAVRVLLDLHARTGIVRGVPFVAVRARDGFWYVREIDLVRAMAKGRPPLVSSGRPG